MMTKEKKAALIRYSFILLLIIGIPAIVFTPSKAKPKDKHADKVVQTTTEADSGATDITNFNALSRPKDGEIANIIAEAAKKRGGIVVGIIHYHAPGNPESEQLADILNRIARRYGKQVKLIRVDIIACPEIAKTEKVTSPPKVVLIAGSVRACEFQGLWTQARIEQKVDELLHGLERVGKDWRPKVKGMQPVGSKPTKPTGP